MTDHGPGIGDTFRTVNGSAEGSVLVLGSKFIAQMAPAATTDEAGAVLAQRERRYPDATHHCWAYCVGRPGQLVERSADAGEPSGTAGRPILDTLRHAGLENAVCVVSRYFGGTKLGTGGLARAYADAAQMAIEASTIITRTVVQHVTIDFDFDRTGVVFRVLEEHGAHLVPSAYDSRAHGTARVPASRVADLQRRLTELAPTRVDLVAGELEIL